MKPSSLMLALGIAVIWLATPASAQPNMGAVNAAIGQAHMQQMMQMNFNAMMQMSMRHRSASLSNPRNLYQIMFKDSTVKETRTQIKFDKDNRSYIEIEDEAAEKNSPNRLKRIYPSETYSIRRKGPGGALSTAGLPADSCWLFKLVAGEINGYSFLPAPYEVHSGYFKFIQKGNGPLLKAETKELLPLLEGNEKALKLARKEKLYDALLTFNRAVAGY
ncbi:hypothetical protein [Rufibacter soli]